MSLDGEIYLLLSVLFMSELAPEPVVALFGLVMQVPPSGCATFSQADMLANLQFSARDGL